MNWCYFNGAITRYEECSLHISDLLIQRGYGVFDFFRCRNGQIPWLEDYTGRLFRSIGLSGIDSPLSSHEFTRVIQNLQEKNGGENTAFKVLVTGGNSENLEQVTGSANMIVLHVPWNRPPEETFKKGVNLISDHYLRPNPEIKTLYYFNSLRLQERMRAFRAVDVLYHTGKITETSRASVFFVKNGSVFTPGKNILNGITRKQVLSMSGDIVYGELEFEELFGVDEMFLTSTSRDVTPVVSVDGRKIGNGKPGKITREIQSAFRSRGW